MELIGDSYFSGGNKAGTSAGSSKACLHIFTRWSIICGLQHTQIENLLGSAHNDILKGNVTIYYSSVMVMTNYSNAVTMLPLIGGISTTMQQMVAVVIC